MTKRENSLVSEEDAPDFIHIVRVLFSQRRKTVKNNLKALGKSSTQIDEALEKANILPTERAEKLTITQISTLVKALKN